MEEFFVNFHIRYPISRQRKTIGIVGILMIGVLYTNLCTYFYSMFSIVTINDIQNTVMNVIKSHSDFFISRSAVLS